MGASHGVAVGQQGGGTLCGSSCPQVLLTFLLETHHPELSVVTSALRGRP